MRIADRLPSSPTAPDIQQDALALTLEHLGLQCRMLDSYDHARLTWDGEGRESFPTPKELRDAWRDEVKPALDAEKAEEDNERGVLRDAIASLRADRATADEVRVILKALVRRLV